MGQMLVRNLDDAVIEKLKRKALEQGTSLEQLARDALTAAATATFDRAAWVARADAMRAQAPGGDGIAMVDLIRELRDNDRLTQLMDEQEAEKPRRDTA